MNLSVPPRRTRGKGTGAGPRRWGGSGTAIANLPQARPNQGAVPMANSNKKNRTQPQDNPARDYTPGATTPPDDEVKPPETNTSVGGVARQPSEPEAFDERRLRYPPASEHQ